MSDGPSPSAPGGERVLIAEDDPVSARVLRSLLQQVGYQVRVAADGEEALRMLEEEGPPDILLLDWMLPGVTGLEVCHRARERWNALELPILMVTARTDPESVYAAFDAGASDYVAKPFRGAELRARIEAQLRVKRLVEERRRMEEHLRERDKLSTLGLVAGGVAHDLNNPLAVIAGHARILLGRAGDEQTAAQLREVLEAVERCGRITGDLLGFARRRPVERRPVDVAGVLHATLALRERALASAGIRLVVEAAGPVPPVTADAHQLQQVFLNVLVNAEQAMRERGSVVRSAVRAEDGWVVVELSNDGPPIAPEA
ncbi:MAG TPA: response regulator, partial [Longimicrobiaceae bacterium]|nr:response regulator [Longimicrobiaceae bacterium]